MAEESVQSIETMDLQNIDIRRFRPSIVMNGLDPFEENDWIGSSVCIGNDLVVQIEGKDPRCSIISNNPNSGSQDVDMINRLKSATSDIYLGIYGLVVKPGRISLGDQIMINV